MSANPLVVISTRLEPGACGIGAHSILLRKHWPDAAKPAEFVAVAGAKGADVLPASDRVAEFGGDASRLQRELERIGRADVVLHYAGRAYHRFGFPLWLPRVLQQWKARFAGARLLVLFHEVPGDRLAITSRHYWLSRLNLHVIRRLTGIADLVVTNTEAHAQQLRTVSGRSDVHVLPIASNVELVDDPQATRAATEFVIFGLSFGRLQVVRAFDEHIRRWHAAGKLTRVHVIGPADDSFATEAAVVMSAWPASLTVMKHGMLPSAEVSRCLQRARFALTNVNEETWSKSGAFMACAAHRCAAVIAGTPPRTLPLAYAVGADELDSIAEGEVARRTTALAEWAVQNASWPVIAARMASLLEGVHKDER